MTYWGGSAIWSREWPPLQHEGACISNPTSRIRILIMPDIMGEESDHANPQEKLPFGSISNIMSTRNSWRIAHISIHMGT